MPSAHVTVHCSIMIASEALQMYAGSSNENTMVAQVSGAGPPKSQSLPLQLHYRLFLVSSVTLKTRNASV